MAWPLVPKRAEAPDTRDSFADHGDKPISNETWKRFLASYDDYFAYIASVELPVLYPDVAEQIYHDMIGRLAQEQDEIHRPKNESKFRSVLIRIYKCMLRDYWKKNRSSEIYAQRDISPDDPAFVAPDESDENERQTLYCATRDYVLDYLSEKNHDELLEFYGISGRDIDIWKRRFLMLMTEEQAGAKYGTKQPDVSRIVDHINTVLREKIRAFLKPFGYDKLFGT